MNTFPNYTENVPLMSDNDWKSDPSFYYRLISGTFKIAKKNLNGLFPSYNEIGSCKLNKDDLFDVNYCDSWDGDTFSKDFVGPISYIGFWLLVGLIFSGFGIIWCLCNKCCCCCKGNKNHLDYLVNTDAELIDNDNFKNYKNNKVLKIVLSIVMGFWILGFFFGTFVSFTSNENLRSSVYGLTNDIEIPLSDADQYLNTTKAQINAVFITSYQDLADEIRRVPTTPPQSIDNALSLLGNTKLLLSEVERGENDVNNVLAFQFQIISKSLKDFENTLSTKVVPFYEDLQTSMLVQAISPELEKALEETGKQLEGNSLDLIQGLNDIQDPINDVREEILKADDDYLNIVGFSMYGGFMTLNVVLLFMLIGMVTGFGVVLFGKGQTKKTGFILYRFVITSMFIIGWIVVIIMVTQFAISGFFSQIACEAIYDLENNDTSDHTATTLSPVYKGNAPWQTDQNGSYNLPSYTHIVQSCKNGQSAYKSLKLEQVYDVNSIKKIHENFENITLSQRLTSEGVLQESYTNVFSSLDEKNSTLQEINDFFIGLSETFLKNSPVDHSKLRRLNEKVRTGYSTVLKEMKGFNFRDNYKSNIQIIKEIVIDYEDFVYEEVTENIGQCDPLYVALDTTLNLICYKLVAPVATYWWSVQFIMIMFITFITTVLITERVYK